MMEKFLEYIGLLKQRFNDDQRGEINIAGLMMMGIAMIFLAVGFIIYPIVLDSTDTILAWTYNGTSSFTISDFTGLEPVAGITPLIVLLGFVVAGAITGFMGIRMIRGTEGGSLNPSSLMMLGIGLIFIAVALIIFPVVLDGVASALDSDSISTYTGLEAILKVTPLIVLTAFLTGGVVSGFFGIRMGLSRGQY